MINKKQIGRIQIIIAVVLFIATIISSIFIIKNVYIGVWNTGVSDITDTWGKVSQEINGTSIGLAGQVVANVVLQGQIVKTTMYLFGACDVILLILSIILFLQGLTNITK